MSGGSPAVVFDFGGVLITPITEKISHLAVRHHSTVPVLLELFLGPRESGEHPWHRAERGEIPVGEIQALLGVWADEAGITLVGDEIEVLLVPTYQIVTQMTSRVAELQREGIATALLTNTFAEFRPTLEHNIDLSTFDQVIESYVVGARKPELAIYLATAEALGAEHRDIIYLDDFEQNLVPARQLGWRTIHVVGHVQALAELDALLES